MKNRMLAGFAALLVLGTAGFAAAQGQTSVTGRVTASQIASGITVGMLEKRMNCHGEADCANRLVQAGGKYVLVTNKGVYNLSDQTKAAQFVAQAVTINGVFDSSRKTIEVADMKLFNTSATTAGLQ